MKQHPLDFSGKPGLVAIFADQKLRDELDKHRATGSGSGLQLGNLVGRTTKNYNNANTMEVPIADFMVRGMYFKARFARKTSVT